MGYVRIVLMVVGVGLTAVVAANYWFGFRGLTVDGSPAEQWYARTLHEGRWVTGNRRIDIQAMQAELAGLQGREPEAVVVGSSRSMVIEGATLGLSPGQGHLLNHAVFSGGMEDHIGLVGLYLKRGLTPGTVVIGADQWIFFGETFHVHPALRAGFMSVLEQLDFGPVPMEEATVWSVPDFLSLNRLLGVVKNLSRESCNFLEAVPPGLHECRSRRSDGSMQYGADWRELAPATVTAEVRLSVSRRGRLHGFQEHHALSARRKELFARFLRLLKERGIHVVLFIPPFHPLVVAAYQGREDWALVEQAETTIRAEADRLAIPVVGGSIPAWPQCDETGFFDAIHARPACIEAIFAAARPSASGVH